MAFTPEDIQALTAGMLPLIIKGFIQAVAEMGQDDSPEPEAGPAAADPLAPPPAADPHDDPAVPDADEVADDEAALDADADELADDGDRETEKYDGAPAGSGGPSEDNTFVPGMADEDEEKKKDKVRMGRTQQGVALARYERKLAAVERENAALRGSVAQLERYARKAARERDLTGKLAEGFEFDLAEELEDCADMDDAAYAKHLKRIARYRRSPVGQPEVGVAGPAGRPGPDADADGLTADEARSMERYARDHGIADATAAVAHRLAAKKAARAAR